MLFGARHSCRKNALRECRSGRHGPNGEIGTGRTKEKDTKEEDEKEKEVEEERRRRRGRINRRESDSGQPNASRHCPRLFAPLSLYREGCRYGAALFAYALNIAAPRARFESSQYHVLYFPCLSSPFRAKKRQRARRRAREGESRRNER